STTSCAASSLNSGSNRFFFDLVIISPELVERDNITQSQVAKFSVPLQVDIYRGAVGCGVHVTGPKHFK
ncbi:hypothetical protein, partial [Microbulbifer sp.]|uniref:hypothetical protein n=1 Tax=Microbulbifer sp. TaxID=1908541 RepID=UPI002588D228